MALNPIRRPVLAIAMLGALAACGTGREDPLVVAALDLVGSAGFGQEDAAPADVPVFTAATVPPELVAQLPGPLMLLEVPAAAASSGMTRVGQNRGDATWRGPNGLGLTLDAQGVMISTRGFGFDLMASDAGPTAAALDARRAGPVERAMIHLDGEAQQVRRVYRCYLRNEGTEGVTIAGRTARLTRMAELCRGDDGYRFENIFWVDGSGRAVTSRQWVSPEIGSVTITILRN